MKINRLTEAINYLNPVRAKQDGGSGNQNPGEQPQKQDFEEEKHEATPEEVGRAIEAFAHDKEAKSAGLSAETVGNGPGLRVVLKDVNGSVLRQFTGDEFLRLRGATIAGPRGKILDQKL